MRVTALLRHVSYIITALVQKINEEMIWFLLGFYIFLYAFCVFQIFF